MNQKLNLTFKRLFIVLSITAFMWSCKMGKNYEAPDIVSPTEYRFGVDSIVTTSSDTIGWWTLIKDPILDTLITIALQNNQDVRVAMQRIVEAEKLYRIQKVQTRPSFDYNGSYTYGTYNGFTSPEAVSNYFGGLQMNWELDLWGKNRRLSEAAMANYTGTVHGLRAVQLSVIANVAAAYVQLLENKASLKVAQETLASRDSSIIIMDARYRLGTIPEIDLNQAQIQQAIAESAVPVYKRGVALSENALSVLLGENPREIVTGQALDQQQIPPVIPAGIPSDLLKRRPDLLRTEQEIVAQNANVGAAIANRFPTISLTGAAGVSSALSIINTASGAEAAWNIGAGIVGPLFQWGKNKRKVEVEKARLEASILEYERSAIAAFQEVEDALASVQYYQEELIARRKHVVAATNAEYLSKQRYDKGVTSYLEYLEQQRTAFEAELNLVTVQGKILTSYVQLYKALGGGWITREEQQQAQE
ncbi:TolC family protein [Flammeovirga sp. SR4]|uniref:TolC family protein n=2 Tax=Flammeovirgaceae TaxID=200667 RepID=A0A7X8XTS1_9BACT|nr:TolC family protein [Flammeovirga agarivorans]